jgi:hypothetical protein
MKTLLVRVCAVVVVVLACQSALALAQETKNSAEAATPAPAAEAAEKAWSFDASVYTYFVPDSHDIVSPVVMADHGWLHLEARYNYENFRTGSIWFGYNFSTGEKVVLDFTAMIGGVLGDTAGIAPGYRLSLAWWKLELTSESEYVIDSRDSSESFFYNWSELAVSPADWFRAGVVIQRTRLYGEDRDVQRGFLVGFSYKKANATAYVFNPDASKPTFVLALGVSF